LRSYPEFIEILRSARWVLTDGGSIQEEASYLGKPCLILRERTERPHGVGTTAKLASFNAATDAAFLRAVECVEERPTCTMSASTIIADYLFERSQDSRH
ncbi:MAG: UDP-N-acetylglucosamine 2-epimerase, partial [Gammaproteobacteria bacterium]|jgi:UDP-N-acetylglucosamine 2-epimerase